MDEQDYLREAGELLDYEEMEDNTGLEGGTESLPGPDDSQIVGSTDPQNHDLFTIDDVLTSMNSGTTKDHEQESDILESLALQAQEKCGPPTGPLTAKLLNCFLSKNYKRIVNGSLDDQSQGATM